MSVVVNYSKATTAEEAFDIASKGITAEYIAKYQVQAELEYLKDQRQIRATGKGFTLTLSFKESEALLDVDLAFLLKPLKKKITESVEKKLVNIL